MRVDRWLWTARLFKTRTLATEACRANCIRINQSPVKPSREIQAGEVLTIKLGPLEKVVRVEGLEERRVSAARALLLATDLTPPQAYEDARKRKIQTAPLLKGKGKFGRPTKRQRRDLEDFLYPKSDESTEEST